MVTKEFEKKKSKLFKHLKNSSELTEELADEIIDVYGSRGERAIKVIKNNGVRKEEDRWFVQGREDEYEIVQNHCSCYDYVLNIVTGKAGVNMCYHALAKTIRQLLNAD
ncbi:hypothetical protein AKJ42_01070 [candidate division MSBL1 archaeon SCGC-AAA261C02]|nr:hypothetical protein AKJ42_01070 [candidate division MSBL1 archaeon SCGC-AAA261C02]